MIKKVLGLTLKFIKVSKGKSHGVIMKTQREKLGEKSENSVSLMLLIQCNMMSYKKENRLCYEILYKEEIKFSWRSARPFQETEFQVISEG